MNFLQWLNSLDELLYEVMSWLIFFPVTLWRSIRHPLKTMAYADAELSEKPEEQFTDVLSPPLFLVLALVVSHGIALAVGDASTIIESKSGMAGLIKDETSFLILRLIVFGLFPIMLATRLVQAQRVPLTRDRLKAPFYAQCFPAAAFALFLGIGIALAGARFAWGVPVGVTVIAATVTAYVALQTIWFSRKLGTGMARGARHASIALAEATLGAFAIALLFVSPGAAAG